MTAELGDPARGVEQDNWDLTLERFAVERLEGGSDTAERLALAIAQLHGAVVEPPEPVLPPRRRAELCWRAHRLLLECREWKLSFPDWLDVLEQQLVLCGAQLWRERVGLEEEAGARALELFERLVQLLTPCPAWVRLACEELRGHGAEEQRLSLAAAVQETGDDRHELLAVLAACCERCSREALHERAWGRALARQNEARLWLEELALEEPEAALGRWQSHALLIYELLDLLHPPLLDPATEERAELLWRIHGLLEAYRRLPLSPPEWLPGLEVHLLQEAAQQWQGLVGVELGAKDRARVLFERLAERLDPCPLWIRLKLKELASTHRHHSSVESPDLAELLRRVGPNELERVVHVWLEALGPTDTQARQPLELIIAVIGALWAEGQELKIDQFDGLGRVFAEYQARLGKQPAPSWPPTDPTRQGLSLALDPRELRTIRQRVLGAAEPGRQLEGLDESDLTWWTEAALCCFTEIGLWGEGSVWAVEAEGLWLYLPLLQAISACSGRIPEFHCPPEPEELASLLADPEVLVLGAVPTPGPGELRAQLETLVVELEALHARHPFRLAVVGPGNYRLPLCQELRRRLSISCVGLDINHTNDILNVAKDTGAAVRTA